jgi:NTP pyrophosphatase (non-canonical NTP hydrolase)
MKREIEKLVIEKGFYNNPEDVVKKLLFAFIELGEASDAWKKGKDEKVIAEELVDVIFYILDASRLAAPSINMDRMFKIKLEKNMKRPYQYGEEHRNKSLMYNNKAKENQES